MDCAHTRSRYSGLRRSAVAGTCVEHSASAAAQAQFRAAAAAGYSSRSLYPWPGPGKRTGAAHITVRPCSVAGLMQARYIAVEGAIGAGKTTLARRLAQTLGAELLLEAPEENPFLER